MSEDELCNSERYKTGSKLIIHPPVLNNTICGSTVAIRGPCFPERANIKCIFHDLVKGPIEMDGYANKDADGIPTAFCIVPFLQDTGRITIDLIVKKANLSATEVFSGYIWVVMPPPDVSAVFMNCETNGELHVSWTASHNAVIGSETVDIGLHAFDPTRKQWINLGTLAPGVPNTGSARVDISKFRNMVTECAIIVSVRRSNANQILGEAFAPSSLTNYDCNGSIMSSFVHRVTSCEVPEYCGAWYQADAGMPFGENVLPCPPKLSQIRVDSNFKEDDSDKAKLLRHFQPDAVFFKSRFPTSLGSGQQCVYSSADGKLIAGPKERGSSANRYNPDSFLSKTLHFLYDVVPFMACCYGTTDDCELYYERRAISNKPYVPPHACAIWGDPHVATCDLLIYHFQGVGEFWLTKSYLPDGTVFFAQVRMEKWPTNDGVSVATALALKDGRSSTVVIQPSKKHNRLQLLLDGHDVPLVEKEIMKMQTFRGFSLVSASPDFHEIQVAFGSGVIFKVNMFTVGAERTRFLAITCFVSALHRGNLQGLLGNFDGRPENDLTTSDGTMIPALPQKQVDGHLETGANLAVLYWSFGMKWSISPSESLFSYSCGKSSSSYFDPSFVPNVAMPTPDTAPTECIQVCGPSGSCLYDCVNVDIFFANLTSFVEATFDSTVEMLLQNSGHCPVMVAPDKGYISGPYGGVVNFGCEASFMLIGPSAITCNNGTWNQPPPVCVKTSTLTLHCPPIVSPLNGQIVSTDLDHATFQCDPDFILNGERTIQCENGEWNYPAPSCVKNVLPSPTAGSLSSRSAHGTLKQLEMTDPHLKEAEEIASAFDIDVDVNVNFNLPNGLKVATFSKRQRRRI